MKTIINHIFVLSIIFALCYGCPEHFSADFNNRRLAIEKAQGFDQITPQHHANRRNLQSKKWRPLAIYFDMSLLNKSLRANNKSNRIQFYKKVFSITGKWWGKALKVSDDRSKIVPMINEYKTSKDWKKDLTFNTSEKNQKKYDLLIRVYWCKNDGAALAWAGPTLRHPQTQRPITGTVCVVPFGDDNFKNAEDSVNRGVGTMVHEFGHVIAFIEFEKYHRQYLKLDNSIRRYKWTGPKVKAAAAEFYGCNQTEFKGLPIQNLNGEIGGHWSETFLVDELMTPVSGENPEKVSAMTLALCEDTKWYKADYTSVENYNHKKGKGCKFTSKCPSPPICKKGADSIITIDKQAVGYCDSDDNGCAKITAYSNQKCNEPTVWDAEDKKYGATYGGNCSIVKGNFAILDSGYIKSSQVLSVQAHCSNSNESYDLTFKNMKLNKNGGRKGGDKKITCTKKGYKFFNKGQFKSKVLCEDPKPFCRARFSTIGVGKCDSSCIKNGRCQRIQKGKIPIKNTTFDQSRILQQMTCNDSVGPVVTTKIKNNKLEVSKLPFGKLANGEQWMCWCYDDNKIAKSCGNLEEDDD